MFVISNISIFVLMTQSKKYISVLLKLIIAAILVYIVYRQLFIKHDFAILKSEFSNQLKEGRFSFFVMALLLVLVNWFLETMRWRNLVLQHHEISFKQAVSAILMGVTMGMISPQRIGEYAGRLMAVPAEKNSGVMTVGVISIICVSLLMIFFPQLERILALEKLTSKFKNWGLFSKYQFSKTSLFTLLALSFARYCVFLVQYVLLLSFFGVTLDTWTMLQAVALVYLIQSSLPLPAMLSLLARGEIALMIFSLFNVNEISILASTFVLWIINLLLPAFFGLILLWKIRLFETIGIENE